MKVLLVAEGSGGHVIPALEVAQALAARGALTKVWYAERRQTARLLSILTRGATSPTVDFDPIPMDGASSPLGRLWHCGQLWTRAQRCFETFAPDVVVGFGGWVSAPVVLAARGRRIGCLVHEQNVVMGRANRLLSRWVDRVALSFQGPQEMTGQGSAVLTGLPTRGGIGQSSRVEAARFFGVNPEAPTLLVLGGSQGARAINRVMIALVDLLSPDERQRWQILHLTGSRDEGAVRTAYAATGIRAWVTPFLDAMALAYAQADLVIARAGGSTIAELARCGTPAILIPYPFAAHHQRANAQLVEDIGGGVMLEEQTASPERLLATIRHLLADQRLRVAMGAQMRTLDIPDAATRLSNVIMALAQDRATASNGHAAHP